MRLGIGPRLVRHPLSAWILLGALALVGAFLATCSRDPGHEESDGTPAVDPPPNWGRWGRVGGSAGDPSLTPEQREEIEDLEAIGYASGSTPAPDQSGVTVHREDQAYPGSNLYISGHAPAAFLMDMNGSVLHTWSADFARAWPEEELRGRRLWLTAFWRRVHLCDNGDLLVIFEGHSLVKLDKDSNILWKSRCGAHHDLHVMPDGDVFVLTREAHVVPRFDEEVPILEDFVTLFGPDGTEKRRFSVLEALERSSFENLWNDARSRRGDIFHTNSLTVLEGRRVGEIPAFQEGNLLISSRTMSFIAVVDPRRAEIVWALRGPFRGQHDPRMLENGNLLLFDNGKDASAVLEIDPSTEEPVWEYRGDADAPFYSKFCGTAQRLPNGNTLITESDSGRAFEVTAAGELVWEFWNPERAGPEGEFIGTLFEMVRLGPDHPLAWLGSLNLPRRGG